MIDNVIVLKFGGSVLESEDNLRKAAGLVEQQVRTGAKVVVVVSALRGETDRLLRMAKKIDANIAKPMLDDILSMGERTSARLFSAALATSGVKGKVIDPDSNLWPIVTDENYSDANPIYQQTKTLVQEKLEPLITDGYVPIVCGFVGMTTSGQITTMGRGGSDTTATLIGSCLGAKEVRLVKDVANVYSSDPALVKEPKPIEVLDSAEAQLLSAGGAKFLHSKSLRFQREGTRLRLSSLGSNEISGTVIDGKIEDDLLVERHQDPISMITIVGSELSSTGAVGAILEEARRSKWQLMAFTFDARSMILYAVDGKLMVEKLHASIVGGGLAKAITSFEELVMITVRGSALETSRGLIQRVTQPLADENINIFGLVTMSSSIKIFLSKEQAERAISRIKTGLVRDDEKS